MSGKELPLKSEDAARPYIVPPKEYQYATGIPNSLLKGHVTRESNIRGTKTERPVSLRNKRKNNLWWRYYKEKAFEWDNAYDQFLNNHQDLEVDLGELGKQTVTVVRLTHDDKDKKIDRPTYVVLVGITNDYHGIGEFPLDLYMSGISDGNPPEPNVVIIPWPEAWLSQMSDEFVDAVEKDPGLRPHIKFATEAINKLFPSEDEKISIFGVSMGAAVAPGILGNTKAEIENMVLIAPPGTVKQNPTDFVFNMTNELIETIKTGNKIFKAFPGNVEKVYKTDKERENMKRVFNALGTRALNEIPWWNNCLQHQNETNILVVAGTRDKITQTIKGKKMLENKGIKVITMEGAHSIAAIRSEELLNIIGQGLKKSP